MGNNEPKTFICEGMYGQNHVALIDELSDYDKKNNPSLKYASCKYCAANMMEEQNTILGENIATAQINAFGEIININENVGSISRRLNFD